MRKNGHITVMIGIAQGADPRFGVSFLPAALTS
jgi:hypothetical protein